MPRRIFLVEDHLVLRRAYAQLLAREADLELCGVIESAETALTALAEADCDLLITDLSLPGMDGAALAARLQDERPDLPVVVLSADDSEVAERRACRAGARAFVGKRAAATVPVPPSGASSGRRGRPFQEPDPADQCPRLGVAVPRFALRGG